MPAVERLRPLLGTLVRVRADAADEATAAAAVEAAFAAIAHCHARMSFQAGDSDLARVARAAPGDPVPVDPVTADCLAAALDLAAATDGAFDPVVPTARDDAWPKQCDRSKKMHRAPDGATWRDIALDGSTVTLRRPLRLDLSGIAKGDAVDRGCAALLAAGATAGLVNAGGDLRVVGDAVEAVALTPAGGAAPVAIRLADGALASSDVAGSIAEYGMPCHRGVGGHALTAGFVSVAAPTCRDADALTKVVLALGDAALPLLAARGAVAWVHDAAGWRTLGQGLADAA